MNIYFADLETSTKNCEYFKKHNDTTVLVGYIENMKNDNGTYFRDLKNMIEFLKSEGKDCIVYFHNLSFDGDFILKYLAKNNYKCRNYNDVKKQDEFGMLRQINKIYTIRLILYSIKTRKNFTIDFKCSLMLLSSSIADLGESIGINKMETDYDLEPQKEIQMYPQQFLDYLKRDVEIQKKSCIYFANEIENFIKNSYAKNFFSGFHWYKFLTIGSMAYYIQKRYVKKFKEIYKGLKCNITSRNRANKFYLGGYTEFNPKWQGVKLKGIKGMCIDINSSYPHSMTKSLPYGEMYDFDEVQPEPNEEIIEYYEISVKMAYAKTDVPCLTNWNKRNGIDLNNKHRYVFKQSYFMCFYMKEEWEYLQKYYVFEGVKIIKRYWCKASKYLSKVVKDLYQFKVLHDKQGQKALKHTYKILLNSLYGKHSTRVSFDEVYICKDENEYKFLLQKAEFTYNSKVYTITEHNERVKLPNTWIVKITPKDPPDWNYNKIIAATITSYSRMHLLDAIYQIGPKSWIYCDTDSVFIKDYDDEKIEPLLDKYELGKWKVEYAFNGGKFNGSKNYVVTQDEKVVKATYSGINKKWLKDNFTFEFYDDMDKVLEKANKKAVSYASGLILEDVDYTPKPRLY